MNAAQYIKILNWICMYNLNLIKYRYIPNLQKNSIFQNKTKIKHNFHRLINRPSKRVVALRYDINIFKNFMIDTFGIISLRTIQ